MLSWLFIFNFFTNFFNLTFLIVVFSFLLNNSLYLIFSNNLYNMDYLFFWKLLNILNDSQYNIVLFLFLFIIILPLQIKFLNFLKIISLLFFFKLDINSVYYFLNNYWNINNVLTNSLSLIHPLLVYILYINSIWVITLSYFNYFIFKSKMYNYTKVVFFALVLGSWWAQQELNWGGWWNWDFIELILFVFFIKYIVYIHNLSYKYKYLLKFNCSNLLLYLIIFFLFVRWDILNSVHSFNTLNFLENYINYILFILLLYIISTKLLLYINLKNYFNNNTFKFFKINFINVLFNVFVHCILSFYYYNIFFVIFYETDILELTCYLKPLLVLIVIILLTLLLNIKKLNLFLILFVFLFSILNFNLLLIFVIFYIYIFYNSYTYVHFFNIILVLCVCISNEFVSYYFVLPKNNFIFNFFLSVDCFKVTVENLKSLYNYNVYNNSLYFFLEDFITFFNLQLFKYILFFNSNTNFLQSLQISNINQLNLVLNTANLHGILYFSFMFIFFNFKIKKNIINFC